MRHRLAATILASCSLEAFGFGILLSPPEASVVEYRNVLIDHYFLTADTFEVAAIDAGSAGPGWIRTGRGFRAYAYTNAWCSGCGPIARFYGTPGLGPNSHFYTESRDEASILRREGSGWTLERESAFAAPRPDSKGACPAGAPIPVRRLYNMRWTFNDSNHRYVTRESDRAEMVAAGWADEGVHFCALREEEIALEAFAIDAPPEGNIQPSAECEDESLRVGPCIAVNNLPVPRTPLNLFTFNAADSFRFVRLTDVYSEFVYVPWLGGAERADGPFVQAVGARYGIHVDTSGKSATQLSSINPLYQFRTREEDGDARFFPWRADYPFETELSIASYLQVKKVATRNADSHVYGHPTLEFIDARSGRHLYFTVLGYGAGGPEGNFLAIDAGTGKVIVGTTHRASTPYGRNLGSTSLVTPPGFEGTASGSFDFRMDRAEFLRVLADARSLDPALSPDPGDYLMDNFHYNNEVVGDGEVGLNLALTLRLMRR